VSTARGLKVITLVPGTGYGDAGCEYIAGLDALGLPVSWMPTHYGSDQLLPRDQSVADLQSEIRSRLEKVWGKEIECDALLLNVPPVRSHWHWLKAEPSLRHFCYLAWEVEVLPQDWAPALNRYQAVFVPSRFNQQALVRGGVTSPVHCLPHVARAIPAPLEQGEWGPVRDDDFLFYTIGAWTTRKAMEETIRAYLDAFTGNDQVGLVVKTEAVNQIVFQSLSPSQRKVNPPHHSMVWWALSRIIADYRNPARIHLVAGRVEPAHIDDLHNRGDCFISLAHSEGWGLGTFDAALTGNPVIITGWGGQLDYLGEDYPLLVDYELRATSEFPADGYFMHDDGVYWASANRQTASELMRAVFENPAPSRAYARALKASLEQDYSRPTICARLAAHMDYEVEDV
jgi:glycosyltransferase involved in cell wall biosynthesis